MICNRCKRENPPNAIKCIYCGQQLQNVGEKKSESAIVVLIIIMVITMETIIKIHLNEKDNYKNTYNKDILSYQLSKYILEELKGIDTLEKIKFSISSNFEMTDQKKIT